MVMLAFDVPVVAARVARAKRVRRFHALMLSLRTTTCQMCSEIRQNAETSRFSRHSTRCRLNCAN